MKRHTLLIALVAGFSVQMAAADWRTNPQQFNFTGSDLGQEQVYTATRGDAGNSQFLSFVRNDHQEVNDVFDRNQHYEGLNFASTSSLNTSNTLHFSSAVSRDEQNFGGVLTQGNWLFGLSAGQGQNFVKSSQAFTGINPYFIHGGSATKFSYYGANAGYSFTNNAVLYFGSSTIQSNQLEDRHASYAGVDSGNFSATLMNFKRAGKSIGKGVDLSAQVSKYQLAYRQISRTNGAHSKTISVLMPTKMFRAGQLGFAVESVNNPLYRDQDGLSAMFTISGQWGKPRALFNAGEDTSEEQTQQPGLNKMAVIGAGVVAGAIIASSGSSSKDDNNIITTDRQNEAARQILNQINPTSVRENREYGGLIFRNPDGSYSNTSPIRGDNDSLLIPLQTPEGTRATAFYHTHAAFDPRYDNENFSPTDINSANRSGLDSYLGTPAGAFKLYDVSARQISTLGTIAN